MINLKTNYNEFISSSQPSEFIKNQKITNQNGILTTTSIAPEIVKYPPMNANFNLPKSTGIDLTSMLQISAAQPQTIKKIPENFDWKKINKNLTPVQQQYQCGSCWAVSTATCIADKFVIKNLIDFNPEISYTYLMSCWINEINMKCRGSNPYLALTYINEFGIGTDKIVNANYDWCTQLTKNCKKIKIDPKTNTQYDSCLCQNANGTNDEIILSSLIPDCKEKNFQDEKNVKFFITKPQWIPLTVEEATKDWVKLNQKKTLFKQHIMNHGPVIGGFLVYKNLLQPAGGNFRCNGKNPANIYLENVNYMTQKFQQLDQNSTVGSHAVVIVGWGSGKITEDLFKPKGDPQKKIDVPYWIVRNSWGKQWGDEGYFNMAMFPINKYSQFDTNIVFQNQTVFDQKLKRYITEDIITGGMIMFEPYYFGYENPDISDTVVEHFEDSCLCGSSTTDSNSMIIYYFIAGLLLLSLFIFIAILLCKNEKKLV